LPKSSIEIKNIKEIKIDGVNTTNLIIKFHEKDMMEREDIRKSINDRNYILGKKSSNDLQEWKFCFPKFETCRFWFTYLLKLKSFFSKQAAKIEEFFKNFDPNKRTSQLSSINFSTARSSNVSSISRYQEDEKDKDREYVERRAHSSMIGFDRQPQLRLDQIREDEELTNERLG
jgi:hypothetical protein